jgi:hypothetical protein
MISSQRLMLIIIVLNMMLGFVGEIYHNPTGYSDTTATVEQQLLEEYEAEYKSDEGLWGTVKATANKIYENTIGNVVSWGNIIFKVFINGLNPFSFTASDFNHPVEKAFANLLVLFRSLMTAILILEGYMIFKNKKSS